MKFANPIFAGVAGGRKEAHLGRQKAMAKLDPAVGRGGISALVAGRILVAVAVRSSNDEELRA